MDNSFGSGGIVTTPILAGDSSASAMTVQVNGKIVVVGKVTVNSNSDFALARYNSDGSIDNTFGNNGVIVTDLGSNYDAASDMAVQSDGMYVVIGSTYLSGNYDFAVVRYLQ